jgi:hypothetical protein
VKNAHRLTGRHLTRRSIVKVLRGSREIRKIWCVIPIFNQLVVDIGPVSAVDDHHDLTSGGALHIFGKLELAAIGQLKAGAKVSVDHRETRTTIYFTLAAA